MDNENLVTIDLEQLTTFISQLESLNVKIDDELIQTNLTEINENLKLLNDHLIVDEDVEVIEEIELQHLEVLEDEPDLYLEQLQSINDNLLILNETVQNQRTDAISELQVKSYGSNIIILFLLIAFGLFKAIGKFFGLANKAI